jgi:nucleotide-binding universal stress UspA family protein
MFQRILVPLDGSPSAEHALPVAARIARASKGSLLLVQVVATTVQYGLYPERHAIAQQEELLKTAHDAAMYYLTGVTYKEELAGLDRHIEVLSGEPADRLLSLIERHQIDVVVMCRRGQTHSQHGVLGRTAHKIVRHSLAPALLVSDDHLASVPIKEHRGVNALVGLDGSLLAERAIVPTASLVTALSAPAHGSLHLVHVVTATGREGKQHVPGAGKMEQVHQVTDVYFHATRERLERELVNLDLSITSSIEAGSDVAKTLIGMAHYQGEGMGTNHVGRADLIAIATHGHGAVQHLMGSVAEQMLSTTTIPLFLIRSTQSLT